MNILSLWACYIELGSLQVAIKIINVYKTIVIRLGEHLSVLPCHKIHWAALGLFKICWNRAKNESVEFTIVYSLVLLNLAVYLWKWR